MKLPFGQLEMMFAFDEHQMKRVFFDFCPQLYGIGVGLLITHREEESTIRPEFFDAQRVLYRI